MEKKTNESKIKSASSESDNAIDGVPDDGQHVNVSPGDDGVPIMTELESPPCHRWSIDLCDGTRIHEVTERGDILSCSCGSKYSWSVGPEDDPCWHIITVCVALLERMGIVSFQKDGKDIRFFPRR